jgi:hypothetical protein
VVAVGDDLGVAVQFPNALGQLAKRDQLSSLDVGDLPLMGLAHVNEHQAASLFVQLAPQLFSRDVGSRIGRLLALLHISEPTRPY